MKVDGPGSSNATGKSKKKDKVSGGDSGFGSMVTDGVAKSDGAAVTHSIAKVDALLAVQEIEDPTAKAAKKRMITRSDGILQELDGLRMGLLTGDLTVGQVVDLADVVSSHREKITDPELTMLLDEIDLRAQIELAKVRIALDNQAG